MAEWMSSLDPRPRETQGRVSSGIALGIGLNVLQALLVFFVAAKAGGNMDRFVTALLIGWGGAGVVQLAYVVPLYLRLRKKDRTETAKGLVIAASLVILINASCWGFLQFKS